jgi:hypothetical protein
MVRKFLLFASIVLILAGPAQASVPSAWLQVGNGPQQLLTGWVQSNGLWYLDFTTQGNGWRASGNTVAHADPYIGYGISFQNFTGAMLPFLFTVQAPIASIAGPTTVFSSYSGSGTDVTGDGFSITPTQPDMDGDGLAELQTTDLNGVNAGVDVGLAYTDGPGIPGHSNQLGVFSSGPKAGPPGGPFNRLDLMLGFNLSDNQDIATLNGYTEVTANPVPEPTSLLLAGMGLVGMALFSRRRRG